MMKENTSDFYITFSMVCVRSFCISDFSTVMSTFSTVLSARTSTALLVPPSSISSLFPGPESSDKIRFSLLNRPHNNSPMSEKSLICFLEMLLKMYAIRYVLSWI